MELNTIHQGNVIEVLCTWPDECVDMVVTSPPYWKLRCYGVDGQLGQENTPEEFVANTVKVFEEVRRVLRPRGTLWLNIGDVYAGSMKGGNIGPTSTLQGGKEHQEQCRAAGQRQGHGSSFRRDRAPRMDVQHKSATNVKPKDLVGIPWMLAFALRNAGWYLRSEIIWFKKSPMPESVTDRPTKAHEQLFLFAKSESYHYDADAIAEDCSPNTHARIAKNGSTSGLSPKTMEARSEHRNGGINPKAARDIARAFNRKRETSTDHRQDFIPLDKVPSGWNTGPGDHRDLIGRYKSEDQELRSRRLGRGPGFRNKQNASFSEAISGHVLPKRNKRDVWSLAAQPFSGAHFATYPEKLVEPCILAGCPGLMCKYCGSTPDECQCIVRDDLEVGVVLDPFMGSGTTAVVAERLGKNWVGCELNPDYIKLAWERIKNARDKRAREADRIANPPARGKRRSHKDRCCRALDHKLPVPEFKPAIAIA